MMVFAVKELYENLQLINNWVTNTAIFYLKFFYYFFYFILFQFLRENLYKMTQKYCFDTDKNR